MQYFIHYTMVHHGKQGDGNTVAHLTAIETIDDIRKIETIIKEREGFDSIVIDNFRPFMDKPISDIKGMCKSFIDANVWDGNNRAGAKGDSASFSPDDLQELADDMIDFIYR